MKVKFTKLHQNAVTPRYAIPGDACADLTAIGVSGTRDQVIYKTGIAVEIPEGYVGLIFPRSSIRERGLMLANSVGVIDSGYRGEITATFNITDQQGWVYKEGDRIAQMMIIPYPQVEFEEVKIEELMPSKRGTGGHGSTGR